MKIRKSQSLVFNFYDKEDYVVHIRTLKQALNHELVSKKSAEENKIQPESMADI